MRIIAVAIIAMGALLVVVESSARAGLVLSFDNSSYSVPAPGRSATIDVLLYQSPEGPQITTGNELLTAGIKLTITSASVAEVLTHADVIPSPEFDASSWVVAGGTVTFTGLSLMGIGDLSPPFRLAQVTLTGLALGTTTISVQAQSPGPSFVDVQGDFLDPHLPATAQIAVLPEPDGFVLASGLAGALIIYCVFRQRIARAMQDNSERVRTTRQAGKTDAAAEFSHTLSNVCSARRSQA